MALDEIELSIPTEPVIFNTFHVEFPLLGIDFRM